MTAPVARSLGYLDEEEMRPGSGGARIWRGPGPWAVREEPGDSVPGVLRFSGILRLFIALGSGLTTGSRLDSG